jgi:hypothetical protein
LTRRPRTGTVQVNLVAPSQAALRAQIAEIEQAAGSDSRVLHARASFDTGVATDAIGHLDVSAPVDGAERLARLAPLEDESADAVTRVRVITLG